MTKQKAQAFGDAQTAAEVGEIVDEYTDFIIGIIESRLYNVPKASPGMTQAIRETVEWAVWAGITYGVQFITQSPGDENLEEEFIG